MTPGLVSSRDFIYTEALKMTHHFAVASRPSPRRSAGAKRAEQTALQPLPLAKVPHLQTHPPRPLLSIAGA
jgi:hypothetical protein